MNEFRKKTDKISGGTAGIKSGPFSINQSKENREYRKRIPGGLQIQFQIALGLLFILFCGLTAWLIYSHEKNLIEQDALNKSRIVLASVESMRSYIRANLRPKMYEFAGQDAFILEAMSTSYITRAVMDKFNESLPEYRYRRVAVRARNPASEPTPVEQEMIQYFDQQPNMSHWKGIRKVNGTKGFLYVQPVRMEVSCLKCHGKQEDAPKSLIELYGDRRGFGYQENQLAGITAISIPMHVTLGKIRSQALSIFWVTLMLLGLLYILISFLFNQMVVRSLQGLLGIFRRSLVDEKEIAMLTEASRKGEIHELSDAAHELTTHLEKTRKELALYTNELEQRVQERTRDLEESRSRLKEKVTERDLELHTLNRIAEMITQSFQLSDILPDVLDQTLALIPAKGAAIYLISGSRGDPVLTLKYQRNADKLLQIVRPEKQSGKGSAPVSLQQSIGLAVQGNMNSFVCDKNQNCLNIPLICRDHVLGAMTFVGIDFGETSSEMRSLLMSVGQQIGITIESLDNVTALLQSKELLQTVFDGIPDMMVLLGRDLKIKMVNRAYLKKYHVRLEEILDRPLSSLSGDSDGTMPGQALSFALSSGQQTSEEQIGESGDIFRVYHYPIHDEDGGIWGVLRYIKNITLEKQVEQRIQQTEKLASLGQLAAGVAHEINNPMGIILCYTDLLKRQLSDDVKGLHDVDIIEKQAQNCQHIVSDLLNFSRSRKTKSQPTDVNRALLQVIEIVRQQFRKRGTEIETDLIEKMPIIPLDADKIKQVFINLLMNAAQAISESPGLINVSTAFDKEKAQVEIRIRDNGIGIAPDMVEKIFDPFFSTKQTGEGTGLGLSVSYGIIKDHHGEIKFQTEVDKGTEFMIRLPVENGKGVRR